MGWWSARDSRTSHEKLVCISSLATWKSTQKFVMVILMPWYILAGTTVGWKPWLQKWIQLCWAEQDQRLRPLRSRAGDGIHHEPSGACGGWSRVGAPQVGMATPRGGYTKVVTKGYQHARRSLGWVLTMPWNTRTHCREDRFGFAFGGVASPCFQGYAL